MIIPQTDVPSHIHVPCRVTDQVIDDNHRPCCVCYSEEGQLSVGYKSGGEDMEIMMTMMMMMIFVLVDDGYVDDIKML
jgi:hypothetical protein